MDIILSPTQEQTNSALVPAAHQAPVIQHVLLSEFIAYALADAGSESANTQRAYTHDWGEFLAYLSSVWGLALPLARRELVRRADGKMNKAQWVYSGDTRIFSEITPSLKAAFKKTLTDKKTSPGTRNRQANSISTLLAIAYRDGYIADDQARRLDVRPYKKRQKSDAKPVGKRLSKEEVRELRGAVELGARNETKRLRDRAVIDCMLFAALRRDEVAHLTPENLRLDGGRWWLEISYTKGSKTRRVKVHDTLFRSLKSWAERAGLELGTSTAPLFCNLTKSGKSTGKQLNASVIGRLVAEYGSLARLAPETGKNCLAPHDLRRTCARNAFDNGAPLPDIQNMLGHADVKTTMAYIGSTQNDDSTAVDFVRY